jgi:hypothetical protein
LLLLLLLLTTFVLITTFVLRRLCSFIIRLERIRFCRSEVEDVIFASVPLNVAAAMIDDDELMQKLTRAREG